MANDNEAPLINGVRHSWAEIQSIIMPYGGPIIRTADITAISFKETMEPGKVRAKGPGIRGLTAGQHDTEGSITMLLEAHMALGEEFEKVARRNRISMFEVAFSLAVSWKAKIGAPLRKVSLIGCRLTSHGIDTSPSSDAIEVETPIVFPKMAWDGRDWAKVPK